MSKAAKRQDLTPETAKQIDDICGYSAKTKQAQCLLAAELRRGKNTAGLRYFRERIGPPVPRAKAAKMFPDWMETSGDHYSDATEADIDALILLGQLNKEKAYRIYLDFMPYIGLNILKIFDLVQIAKQRAPRGETLAKQVVDAIWADDKPEEQVKRIRDIPAISKEWANRG